MTQILPGALACALGTAMLSASQNTVAELPPRLDQYLTSTVGLTADERKRLLAGAPVTKLLDVADDTKEVAVFGGVWIDAPIRRYVEAVKDIEQFERGAKFKVTKRISTPPRLEDFDRLHLPDEDVKELPACRVGDCSLKLGERALQRFRSEIDWNDPGARAAADALMRQLALEWVTGYLEGGNTRLPVYRDHAQPMFGAQEFRSMIDQMPELTTYMPDMRRYLLEYPKVALPDATSFLYWQETDFGLKPTIRISHLTIREGSEDTVIASKMLYATHYFWTGIELRTLLPDPPRGSGFWFITVNRSRSDGLSGFRGLFVGPRVRREVQEGTLAALQSTKQRLERPR